MRCWRGAELAGACPSGAQAQRAELQFLLLVPGRGTVAGALALNPKPDAGARPRHGGGRAGL